jgi:hypothetical protein
MDTGTAGTRQRGALPLGAKTCTNAPHLLTSPLAKGDALLHGGGQRARELRGVIHQWVIACRDCGVEARFQVPALPQCADDAPADLLHHVGDGRVGRWLTLIPHFSEHRHYFPVLRAKK